MAYPKLRRAFAGSGWVLVALCTTAIGIKYGFSTWAVRHDSLLNEIIIGSLIGAIAIAVLYFATDESHPPEISNSSFAGHDNLGTQISGSIVGDAALEKLLKVSSRTAQTPSKLYIQSAEYISTADPARFEIVTDCMRELVRDDQLVFEIQNHNFRAGDKNCVPEDPHPNVKKKLRVVYSFNNGPLREVVQLETTILKLPQVEEASDNSVRLEMNFVLTPLVYKVEHSAWDEATQFDHDSREAVVAWFSNPVPPKGVRGVDASQISAHIKYTVEGHWSEQVSRGYWLHYSANEITINPADRAGLILGLVDWSHWVSYENPYTRPASEGILQPAFRHPGKEKKMPKADMDIEVSLLSNNRSTLDQQKIHLCFTNGRPFAVRIRET